MWLLMNSGELMSSEGLSPPVGNIVQMQSSLHQERLQRQQHEEAAQKAEAALQLLQEQGSPLQAKLMASALQADIIIIIIIETLSSQTSRHVLIIVRMVINRGVSQF